MTSNLKICNKGHKYYKSSDCPTCPICEQRAKTRTSISYHYFQHQQRRALENNGVTSLKSLSTYSEKEILKFHGMGPASIPKLRSALSENGLSFKK